MTRLSQDALRRIGGGVQLPGYERGATRTGVVHFGPGAFHRVHQACYLDDLLHTDNGWGICGVSLRTSGVHDALTPQDCLYTLAVLDEESSFRVIGALRELLVAAASPATVFERLCSAHVRLVTSTVTEKGYCLAADGALDFLHPDIQRDLATPDAPVSVIGYLVEGLRRRREAKLPPFTVLCCDNLSDNGGRLQRAVVQLARERDRGLAAWIEAEVAFPRTMVDSITPATDDALRSRVREVLGVDDCWPVQRESYLQWVIEENPLSCAPELRQVGVIVTDDVAAYERAKLRLLNGAHSSLAYLGTLVGHRTVAEAIADPDLLRFVQKLMTEDILPSLTAPRDLDLRQYVDAVLRRFRNARSATFGADRLDGSKATICLFGTIMTPCRADAIDRLCIPIAAWLHS
jgi:fructuronate reductase